MVKFLAHALGIALILVPGSAAAEVQVRMHDGLVTLSATGATVREILTEWARVGQARIVNMERISGSPVTLQLTDVPEQQALDIVLRSVAGYLAAPRDTVDPNLSRYDRILVLATSTAPRNVPAPPQQSISQQQPRFPSGPVPDEDEPDDVVQGPPGPGGTPARGPVFNTFPQPIIGATPNDPSPNQPPPAFPTPGFRPPTPGQVPAGVAVPGMVPPQPASPQPGQFPVPVPVPPQ
jgi:hypothetical protein